MGRRRQGPVKASSRSDNWYARLTVPPALREQVGKARLIRSLGTSNHAVALTRYSKVYAELEKELQALLKPKERQDLRQEVEANRDPEENPGILTELLVGLDDESPTEEQLLVYQALKSGKSIPLSWDEAVELWLSTRNKMRSRPVAASTVDDTKRNVRSIQKFGSPADISKKIIEQWIDQQEQVMKPTSVKAALKKLSAVFTVLAQKDHIPFNPFQNFPYSPAQKKVDERREFTDAELKIIKKECPEVFMMCLTSLRAGEFASRLAADVQGDILVIDEQPTVLINRTEHWRPKTLTSYRRVPIPKGFKLSNPKLAVRTKKEHWQQKIRSLFYDETCTPHSARHSYYTLARRAGCDIPTMEAIAGHSSEIGSKTAQEYGKYTDDARRREIKKLWKFVQGITN